MVTSRRRRCSASCREESSGRLARARRSARKQFAGEGQRLGQPCETADLAASLAPLRARRLAASHPRLAALGGTAEKPEVGAIGRGHQDGSRARTRGVEGRSGRIHGGDELAGRGPGAGRVRRETVRRETRGSCSGRADGVGEAIKRRVAVEEASGEGRGGRHGGLWLAGAAAEARGASGGRRAGPGADDVAEAVRCAHSSGLRGRGGESG